MDFKQEWKSLQPNARFIASVGDQKPNNGNRFVFVVAIQKKNRQSGLFFLNWDNKKKQFWWFGFGFLVTNWCNEEGITYETAQLQNV